ncbi:hypothetical protein PoB_002061600 [Plakobranchus ocellatus]|uniref:Uncharacterized protein n=1 Tax=Plakobranchus ocellatus TaxID=259542 RepID=A0AAV3ZDY7_9GAST|nr:hypothetical protein PoB_002061600 [Plakobranchus ocellatus]
MTSTVNGVGMKIKTKETLNRFQEDRAWIVRKKLVCSIEILKTPLVQSNVGRKVDLYRIKMIHLYFELSLKKRYEEEREIIGINNRTNAKIFLNIFGKMWHLEQVSNFSYSKVSAETPKLNF